MGQHGLGKQRLRELHGFSPAHSGVLSNIENLPLVTKMCHTGCPDIPSLGLGPYVSIACCQTSLCNHD